MPQLRLTPTSWNWRPIRWLNTVCSIHEREDVMRWASTYGKTYVILICRSVCVGRSTGVKTGRGQWCPMARRRLPWSQMPRGNTVCWAQRRRPLLSASQCYHRSTRRRRRRRPEWTGKRARPARADKKPRYPERDDWARVLGWAGGHDQDDLPEEGQLKQAREANIWPCWRNISHTSRRGRLGWADRWSGLVWMIKWNGLCQSGRWSGLVSPGDH